MSVGSIRVGVGSMLLAVLVGSPPPSATGQSPQFRRAAAHTGVAQTQGVERLAGVLWRVQTQGAVRSSPALVDGTVYVGSADGFLYALDADDGSEVWRFDVGSPIASSPGVSDGVVMISGRSGVLHGVSVADGRSLWSLETGPDIPLPWGHEGWDYIHGSVSIANGMGYWGSGDGYLHAFEPATGRARWRFQVASRIRTTAAISGNLLVFGDSDGYVYALDAMDGGERWRFATDGVGYNSADFGFDRRQISASPALAADEVFVAGRDASVYALNASDGSLRWRFDEGSSWVIATPAVDDTRVFSARSSSGNVRAIDRQSGEEIWSFGAGDFVYSSPVLVDNVLYLGQGDGEISAHDADTGETLWAYQTGASIYSSPVVEDGRLYVGSDDGGVYALAAGEQTVRRAVFYDSALAGRSILGRRPEHDVIGDYFVSRGYERLDASTLVDFLEARLNDGAPSVVILGMDGVPSELHEGNDPLIRRYLDAGGKIVSMGSLPGQLVYNEDGQIVRFDQERAGDILDVDFSSFDGDRYTVVPTEAGRAWGLETWWTGTAQTLPEHVSEVLARNELGRVVAWVKSYGGPAGTGFVNAFPTWNRARLAEIQRMAEHGLAGTNRGR